MLAQNSRLVPKVEVKAPATASQKHMHLRYVRSSSSETFPFATHPNTDIARLQALLKLQHSSEIFPPPTMSIDPPEYIVSLKNNIRARPISWEGAVRAKTITDEDLKKIKAIDKVRKEQRKVVIEADVQTYTDLLLGNAEGAKSIFESAAKRTDILQYMLVLTGDLIDGVCS